MYVFVLCVCGGVRGQARSKRQKVILFMDMDRMDTPHSRVTCLQNTSALMVPQTPPTAVLSGVLFFLREGGQLSPSHDPHLLMLCPGSSLILILYPLPFLFPHTTELGETQGEGYELWTQM